MPRKTKDESGLPPDEDGDAAGPKLRCKAAVLLSLEETTNKGDTAAVTGKGIALSGGNAERRDSMFLPVLNVDSFKILYGRANRDMRLFAAIE